ncbi:DUF5908 family protein [Hymenobacter ruricola]|uniref:Uncharacterized protein n=1 Tax=Hymenobacter ruricola TaxID=2791023 RepID=A0ABS0I6S3_9BACT|nr:DUF5908 family protein [Hymenobacter ruricola]MBF9222669.1 hypothetical protein [Hymenobacter ruricola]
MPIEIRELVIKVTVQDDARPAQPPPAGGLGGPDLQRWQQELTRACVQEVLDELSRRAER